MINKSQLDFFILKEASKYINEQEEDFFAQDALAQDEAIEQAESRLREKKEDVKQLDIRKKMHQASISKMVDPTDRNIEMLQAKKFEERLKTAKEEEIELKNKIDDLNKAKSDSEKLKTQREKDLKAQQGEEANLGEALGAAPVKKVKPKKREMVVRFDTNTNSPFTVKFTSRGFVVGNTRLSFELIEKAISKQFSITLKTGLVLTPVKMQKILKYKNRY